MLTLLKSDKTPNISTANDFGAKTNQIEKSVGKANMPLSANTLIHFTKEKDTLKKILGENFRIFNCKETITFGADKTILHIPLVSFCDIPPSEVKDHMSKYGSYGIGMTKEWGMRKGLNPVLYVAQESNLSTSYKMAFNYYTKVTGAITRTIDNLSNEQRALVDLLRYIKNYEADLTRWSVTTPNYRFSDEREWRYVPPYSEECDMLRFEAWYAKPDNKAVSDAKLVDLRLEFEPNDIKYIIINDDAEIGEFIGHLRDVKGKKYTLHDVDRLTTRILTTEQIKGDMQLSLPHETNYFDAVQLEWGTLGGKLGTVMHVRPGKSV